MSGDWSKEFVDITIIALTKNKQRNVATTDQLVWFHTPGRSLDI